MIALLFFVVTASPASFSHFAVSHSLKWFLFIASSKQVIWCKSLGHYCYLVGIGAISSSHHEFLFEIVFALSREQRLSNVWRKSNVLSLSTCFFELKWLAGFLQIALHRTTRWATSADRKTKDKSLGPSDGTVRTLLQSATEI